MYNSVKRKERISELIFHQVRQSILDGSLKTGQKLPPEREMVIQFEASRIAVREGLRSLEAAGLIEVKRGSGSFVSEVTSKKISDSILTILPTEISISSITQARVVFEPSVARLAAAQAAPEDIARLERNIHSAEEVLSASTKTRSGPLPDIPNIGFHSIVAQSTHNMIIELFMTGLVNVLHKMTLKLRENQQKRIELSRRALANHKHILMAIRDHSPERAYRAMLNDVLMVQKGFAELGTKPARK